MSQENQAPEITCLRVGVENILSLRHEILRPGLPFETAMFEGDTDLRNFHFASVFLQKGPGPVCCVSYFKNEYNSYPAFQLRGMATKKEYQGKKFGRTLMLFAETFITRETGINLFWCNARVESIGFYEKQGWSCVSEIFDIQGVGPHIKMVKL